MKEKLKQVCKAFRIAGELVSFEEIQVGNVNHTFKVNFVRPDGKEKSYIVQKVNTFVFKQPEKVMDNIDKVTEYIHQKDPHRKALHFHHTANRKNYLAEEDGFWRLFNYIPSATYNVTDDLEVVGNAGEAFGEFQMILSDFEADRLFETIPDFHNTSKRFEKLLADAQEDPCDKVKEVEAELAWLKEVKDLACRLTTMHEQGDLPLRVTHNDTKINNVLFDRDNKKALVVIDLDTVMPGLVGHDFGDAIRFAANFVEEDCKEAEKAGVNLAVFEAFADGFLKWTAKTLTENEVNTLALSSFVLTVELATRFLDDYILGSPYFKIYYPEHNLVRTRCQIALAKDMLEKMPQMEAIVRKCAAKYC
ncbi:MAG: aminoglycoside phosphotransferase family protein [Clostridiales bacterium]|nr:aminoglycoside phosphotransferase family protein [Clostridiales bacterium]